MSILRLQHIGVALADHDLAVAGLERVGLPSRDFRNDQGKGFQHDSRVLLGNECWLHIVHNWNPESRVNRFLENHGEGLEHLALESDDIEADVARVRDADVPIFEDRIFDANDGFEAFVYPEDGIGFTVELIKPHATSWSYPDDALGLPVSALLGTTRARRVGAYVRDVAEASRRFTTLFGTPPGDEPGTIALGNVELHLQASADHEPGLKDLVLETEKGTAGVHDLGFLALETRAARVV